MNGFRISAYMQERMAYAGQSEVYNEGNDLINRFLGVEVNSMQLYRVTDRWGKQSSEVVNQEEAKAMTVSSQENVYVELDGAMVLTREEKWQEVKTGRIFRESDIRSVNTKKNEIINSLYTSKLGTCESFLKKFEPLVDVFDKLNERLIILSDGALWIGNWATSAYPKATHILDYYHACQHLSQWINIFISTESEQKKMLEQWKELLLKQGVKPIIKAIKFQKTQKKKAIAAKAMVLKYLEKNTYRMDYPSYKERGLQIGSGAIEAAQRTVLQKRLKRSGQRWSQKGVQNMLNLRVAFLSNKWTKVIQLNTRVAA